MEYHHLCIAYSLCGMFYFMSYISFVLSNKKLARLFSSFFDTNKPSNTL